MTSQRYSSHENEPASIRALPASVKHPGYRTKPDIKLSPDSRLPNVRSWFIVKFCVKSNRLVVVSRRGQNAPVFSVHLRRRRLGIRDFLSVFAAVHGHIYDRQPQPPLANRQEGGGFGPAKGRSPFPRLTAGLPEHFSPTPAGSISAAAAVVAKQFEAFVAHESHYDLRRGIDEPAYDARPDARIAQAEFGLVPNRGPEIDS